MRGSSLDRKVKTDDEESGSSALTMRAPPVQIDKAFLEGEPQEVFEVEGLAGITGKQPVKLDLEEALIAEAAREKFIEFCASDKAQLVKDLNLAWNSLGYLNAAALEPPVQPVHWVYLLILVNTSGPVLAMRANQIL